MISKLSVTNFKAFQASEFNLGQLTLLSGLNSSGKSTVLQALALLRQSHDAGTLALDDKAGGFLLNGDFVELGVGRDVRHESWVPIDGGEGAIEIAVTVDGKVFRWSALYGTEDDLLPLNPPRVIANGAHFLPLFAKGFQYLKADRITPAVSYPRSHEVAIRRGFLGSRGEHTVNYLRHHQDDIVQSEAVRHPDAASASLLSQTEAWLRELCPGVNLEAAGIDGTDTVRLSYRFGSAGISSSNSYRPTNVGFGLTYILPVVVACLASSSDTLLLIENPEAHLHPRGQTAMARLISGTAASGAQVIVETHSDHILNGVRLSVKRQVVDASAVVLHYFKLTQKGVQTVSPVVSPSGMLSTWPDGFFDEWDRLLDELVD
jgi:predicted ATPase